MHDLTCDEVQDRAPSFALDILEPTARADVAAHLLRCAGCAREVSGMQESAAELLDLSDPDGRFEGWQAGGYEHPYPGDEEPPRRRRFRLVAAMTAAAMLMVGTTFGPEIGATNAPRAIPVASAPLTSGDSPVGYVYFYGGSRPVLVVDVSGLDTKGRLTCAVAGTDGSTLRLGSFKLVGTRTEWAVTDRLPPSATADVVLLDPAGQVVASATVTG